MQRRHKKLGRFAQGPVAPGDGAEGFHLVLDDARHGQKPSGWVLMPCGHLQRRGGVAFAADHTDVCFHHDDCSAGQCGRCSAGGCVANHYQPDSWGREGF